MCLRRIKQNVQTLGVEFAHPANMTSEVSFRNEVTQNGLFE